LGLDPQTMQPTVSMMPQGEITLARGAEADAKWTVAALRKADRAAQRIVDDAIAEDEEVTQSAITDLLTGLEDLAIADVERKPEGLSADLKAGEAFMSNEEAITDLMEKGFIPGRQQSGADMLSSEGELVVTLRNGVEYVLRFGRLKVTDDEGDAGDAQEAGGADGAAAERPENLRRYLFVMANFEEDAVEKPTYKELPALPAEAAASAEGPAGGDDSAENETPGGAASGEGAGEAGAGPATESEGSAGEDPAGNDAAAEDAAGDDGAPQAQSEEETGADAESDSAAGTGASAPAAVAAAPPQGQAGEDGDPTGEETDGQDSGGQEAEAPAQAPTREAIIAQREAIEQENEQARADYEALLSEGREQATALNERFGDWYFVISNETFKKIHIGRAQVITKKAPPEAAEDAAGAEGSLPGLPNLGAPAPGAQP
ncbi:MAG TPA: hypothetical protein VEQ85_04220, partial [Lacipirellulaceae bacterium]|nr:hypothetical protein [Lacipirellulaceae bacterium]